MRIAFLIPLLMILTFPLVSRWVGPHYLSENLDPDYPYLVNSLAVRLGKIPGHWDHPGSTLQAVGGLTVLALTVGVPEDDVAYRVLGDSEWYAWIISIALIILYSIGVAYAGIIVWRATREPYSVILFQSLPFAAFSTWSALPKLSPDILTMVLGMILMAKVSPLFLRENESIPEEMPTQSVWLVGILVGLILTTKITGLSLAVIPLLIYRKSKRHLTRFLLATALSALAILLLVQQKEIIHFFRYFAGWLWRLALHRGKYGSGDMGVPTVGELAGSLWQVVLSMPFIALVFLLMTGFLFWGFQKKQGFQGKPVWRLFVSLMVVTCIQVLVVAKHPGDRYLIPQFACLALAFLVFLNLVFRACRISPYRQKCTYRAVTCVVLVIFLSGPLYMALDRQSGITISESKKMDAKMAELGCREVLFYRATSVRYALAFGNSYSRLQFSDPLDRLYPNYVGYDPDLGFVDFNRRPLSSGEVVGDNGKKRRTICLRGTYGVLAGHSPFSYADMTLVMRTHEEALFFLTQK